MAATIVDLRRLVKEAEPATGQQRQHQGCVLAQDMSPSADATRRCM
jgi:hypothetical protein